MLRVDHPKPVVLEIQHDDVVHEEYVARQGGHLLFGVEVQQALMAIKPGLASGQKRQ